MASVSVLRWSCLFRTSAKPFIPPTHALHAQRTIHVPPSRPAFQTSLILSRRRYQHLSRNPPPPATPPSPKKGGSAPRAPPNSPTTPAERELSTSEQRRNDWAIIKRLLVHIWPKNDWGVRRRVVFGLGLLIVGKVIHTKLQKKAIYGTFSGVECPGSFSIQRNS